MIKKLIIKNYALIDELEIDFGNGLSIITGETGAGKSIMLGALGLLLGERADTKVIADNSKKTIVEATFEVETQSAEIPTSGKEMTELIIRREIQPSGRSRAFIDDSPVTLVHLGAVTSGLLDIHSQHANLNLTSKEGQLKIIDAMAGDKDLLEDYQEIFRNYVAVRNRLRKLKEHRAGMEAQSKAISMQLEQLVKLNVKPGEQDDVERNFELLNDAESIQEHLYSVSYLLEESDSAALTNVAQSIRHLDEISDLIEKGVADDESMKGRLTQIGIELKDIADSAGRMADSMESNPARLAKVASRMKELYDAAKAFHVERADELIDIRAKLEQELKSLTGNDEESASLERECRQMAKHLKEMADKLTLQREKAAKEFSGMLAEKARPLGLNNLKFEVKVERSKVSVTGQDNVEFLCSFNKNGELLPMASTASGGELSRLTLTIKSIMAKKMQMPTVIFDEIDTGVSGEIAAKMGKMMVEMAENIQIMAITHLPQVAAKGERHYKVMKQDTQERTISRIKELSQAERIEEIAGMLSGEEITEAALTAARELVENNTQNG